jgi:hypothetical protein
MSDFAQALEEAIRSTGVERYRWLTGEANTLPPPNDAATWREFIAARRWRPIRSVDEILAEAKAQGIPARVEPKRGCCGGR